VTIIAASDGFAPTVNRSSMTGDIRADLQDRRRIDIFGPEKWDVYVALGARQETEPEGVHTSSEKRFVG
jgi:hypothetical protein